MNVPRTGMNTMYRLEDRTRRNIYRNLLWAGYGWYAAALRLLRVGWVWTGRENVASSAVRPVANSRHCEPIRRIPASMTTDSSPLGFGLSAVRIPRRSANSRSGEPGTQRLDLSASTAASAIRAKAGSDFVSVFAMIDARWFSTVR